MDEARGEFENVVKFIPDNLYAHKKLAEIYRDTGNRDLAIESFKAFLKLNPMDEEALNNLRELEGAYAQPGGEKAGEQIAPVSEKTPDVEEGIPFQAMSIEQATGEQAQVETEEHGEELDAFKESLFGFKGEAGDGSGEESPSAGEEITEEDASAEEDKGAWSFGEMESGPAGGAVEEDSIEIVEAADEDAVELSFGGMESGPAGGAVEEAGVETVEGDHIEIEETPVEGLEELSFSDMADVLKTAEEEEVREAAATTDDIYSTELSSETGSILPADCSGLLQDADRFISEGKFMGAINIYQRILASTQGDKKALQGIEELRSLLKLMGKDKEVLISKLDAFQSAIKKRGNEFFGRS